MPSAHILIVDDETNIRLMLRVTLESDGYTVEEAADGRLGLDAIARRIPDVVILDLSMPAIDGLGVLRELRNMRAAKRPRVIVLTAYGSIPAAVKATRLGAMDFLEKPVSPDEVRESVQSVLSEPSPVVDGIDGADVLSGGYDGVLDRIRKAIRLARYTDAETLMMKAADLAHNDAAYLNLLGVLYEVQREWRLARKFYNKALDVKPNYDPARKNLRRLADLKSMGRTTEPAQLGDESGEWLVRLPDDRQPAAM